MPRYIEVKVDWQSSDFSCHVAVHSERRRLALLVAGCCKSSFCAKHNRKHEHTHTYTKCHDRSESESAIWKCNFLVFYPITLHAKIGPQKLVILLLCTISSHIASAFMYKRAQLTHIPVGNRISTQPQNKQIYFIFASPANTLARTLLRCFAISRASYRLEVSRRASNEPTKTKTVWKSMGSMCQAKWGSRKVPQTSHTHHTRGAHQHNI